MSSNFSKNLPDTSQDILTCRWLPFITGAMKTAKIASLVCQVKSKAQDKMDLEDNIKNINFNKLRGKLNIILLSQYLLSTGHLISEGDLAHIQNTDRDINSLNKQCEGENKNYLISNDI